MRVVAVDQSLTGTAICGLEDGRQFMLETLKVPDSMKGLERVAFIVDQVKATLTEFEPEVFVLEDYSVSHVHSAIGLIELGGCIKLMAHKLHYEMGREPILRGRHVLMIQSATSMKKFNLGQGNVTKDTSYLLKVHQRLGQIFDDDNKADAYMHAVMAGLVYKVTRGEVPISNLTNAQQEALISPGVKRQKNLSMTKAMKLSDDAKLALAGF